MWALSVTSVTVRLCAGDWSINMIMYFIHMQFCTLGMGSHSKDSQKKKRTRQKKKKRCRKKILNFTSSNKYATSCSLTDNTLNPVEQSDSDEPLCLVLDRLAKRSEEYWEETGKDIDDVESYRDVHPTIVMDKERHIEVLVAGERQDTSGIIRVSTEEYFSRLHEREMKSSSVCKSLRDQVEVLEEKIVEMKQEMMKVQRENSMAVGRVRNFWRNKILEEGSRGGAILMAALRGQHSYK